MPGIKTAISLDENLFNSINKLSKEMHVSRSRLFTLAVKDYLKKQENQTILAQLNKAYGEQSDPEEKLQTALRNKQVKIIEQEPW